MSSSFIKFVLYSRYLIFFIDLYTLQVVGIYNGTLLFIFDTALYNRAHIIKV